MLAAWGAFANAGAIAYAALKGSQWLEQRRDTRRLELAERILEVAYLTEDAFQAIRSGMSTVGDVQRARKNLGLSEAEIQQRVQNRSGDDQRQETAQIVMDRIADHSELWTKYFEVLPSARAYFGLEVSKALRNLLQMRQRVYASALVYGTTPGLDRPAASKFEADFWSGWGQAAFGKDEVGEAIAVNVASIEAILLPKLGTVPNISPTRP